MTSPANRFISATRVPFMIAAALMLCRGAAEAQTSTDLFLVQLSEANGRVSAGTVTRLTSRPGYDNQPHFLPGGGLLYTLIDSTGQADIHRIDLATRRSTRVTRTTPESEYSATLMPAGDRFSVIRVERDSAQRLWSFTLNGEDPRVVLESIRPVGYHAWIDARQVAIFVLGNPSTLQIADVSNGQSRILAQNIGRSLHRVPARNAISFVHRAGGGPGTIRLLDPNTGSMTDVIAALPENEYHAWTPSGLLLSARGSQLLQHDVRSGEWIVFADLAASGVRGISRLAVSPDGRQLAIVAEE